MRKKTTLLKIAFISILTMISISVSAQWTIILNDAVGDGADNTLMDGTLLEYNYDVVNDSLWFRITVDTMTTDHSSNLGANVMVNFTGGGLTFNFWGIDNTDAFHRLVTTWVSGAPPSSYVGTVGIADNIGVNTANYANLYVDNISIIVDEALGTIVLGMNREDLIPNSAMGQPILVAAAVGSDQFWNDDIYSPFATITLSSTGIRKNTSLDQIIQIGPNPTNGILSLKSSASITGNLYFNVSNALGQTVIEEQAINFSNNFSEIRLQGLENGIYYITLKNQEEQLTHKFILSK